MNPLNATFMEMKTKNNFKGLVDNLSHVHDALQGTESRSPTYGMRHRIKAVSLAYHGDLFIRKAFSLEKRYDSYRRALPFANIRKAFSLYRMPRMSSRSRFV